MTKLLVRIHAFLDDVSAGIVDSQELDAILNEIKPKITESKPRKYRRCKLCRVDLVSRTDKPICLQCAIECSNVPKTTAEPPKKKQKKSSV